MILYGISKIVEAVTVFVVFLFWWAISYSVLKALIDSIMRRVIAKYQPNDSSKTGFWNYVYHFTVWYPVIIGTLLFLFYACYFVF